MEILENLLSELKPGMPLGATVLAFAALLYLVHRIFEKRIASRPNQNFVRQITMLIIMLVGILLVIVVSPLSDAQKGQLLGLIGILLSATIALSSTTFLGNAMAGIMLRVVRGFRMGDFIRVDDHFGRVSERGLFHTEIQTEERDLTTLPNLYLVTNPVQVIRASGSIISAQISLGYDVPRTRIENLLLKAAKDAELSEPYVHVVDLGDFSVTYRVAGLLTEVKQIISARSRLRKMILDALHEDGIEIVSPSFMNTRAYGTDHSFIPVRILGPTAEASDRAGIAEALAFDKAEEAESTENLQARLKKIEDAMEKLEKLHKESAGEEEKAAFLERRGRLEEKRDQLAAVIASKSAKLDA